jgi:hypothetical protein
LLVKPIPFIIEWDGIKFSGTLTPTGEKFALVGNTSFMVNISFKGPMHISKFHGKWRMPGAPQKFVNILGLWIENYYD